ncbi:MAG: AraC family transcriptional regulator [Vallitaleaceae bacterium]|jgi:xylan 1,4-beta-xylosidase|nr:AraC family transcriptional regulator [Vallitaleaceae bacterium]
MQFEYEVIKHNKGLPFKAFFASINSRGYHWHSDLELIWMLKGSVRLQLSKDDCIINSGDLYLLNTNEVHCLRHTTDDNLLLAIQINEAIASHYFESLLNVNFEAQHFSTQNDLSIFIKKSLAAIMLNTVHGEPTDLMAAVGGIHILMARLIKEVPFKELDKQVGRLKQNELDRLKKVIGYVNEHYTEKISLQQLADEAYISRYHLSHFIKDKLGIGFQSFVNLIRMEKAVTAIIDTDEKILDISEKCGFSDVKYLNKLLKEEYHLTGKQLRSHYQNRVEKSTRLSSEEHRQFSKDEAINILKDFV